MSALRQNETLRGPRSPLVMVQTHNQTQRPPSKRLVRHLEAQPLNK